MYRGRGGAVASSTAIVAALVCLLASLEPVRSAQVFQVGGATGWRFGVSSWTQGLKFVQGDTLEFKYNPALHNVVEVDKVSHDNCVVPAGAKVHNSGDDKIVLKSGTSYFICGFPGHCQSGGMHIAVTAA